jgi:hypothetical protein
MFGPEFRSLLLGYDFRAFEQTTTTFKALPIFVEVQEVILGSAQTRQLLTSMQLHDPGNVSQWLSRMDRGLLPRARHWLNDCGRGWINDTKATEEMKYFSPGVVRTMVVEANTLFTICNALRNSNLPMAEMLKLAQNSFEYNPFVNIEPLQRSMYRLDKTVPYVVALCSATDSSERLFQFGPQSVLQLVDRVQL